MLPKTNRIRKKNDFEKIFKNSKIFKTDFFILRVAKNNLESNRFTFIVSQKVSKKAVVRNKIRRRCSEIIKITKDKIKLKGLDLLFTTLPGIEKKDFSNLEKGITECLIKARIINNKNV